jgi:uncharacterized membrane protein
VHRGRQLRLRHGVPVIGAWPVFGFFGLDVLLVYWAFRANFRAARAYEVVTVTACELTVRKVSHRGRVREWTLNPLWVRLDRIVHEEFGIERLFLVSRGRRLPIAAFLGPDEKASFARALSTRWAKPSAGPRERCCSRQKSGGLSAGGALDPEQIDGGTHAVARPHSGSNAARRGR